MVQLNVSASAYKIQVAEINSTRTRQKMEERGNKFGKLKSFASDSFVFFAAKKKAFHFLFTVHSLTLLQEMGAEIQLQVLGSMDFGINLDTFN